VRPPSPGISKLEGKSALSAPDRSPAVREFKAHGNEMVSMQGRRVGIKRQGATD